MKLKLLITIILSFAFFSCQKETQSPEWPWPWTIDYVAVGYEELNGQLRPVAGVGLKNITEKTFDNFKGVMTLRLKYAKSDVVREIPMTVSTTSGMANTAFGLIDITTQPNKPGDTLHVLGISSQPLGRAEFEPIPDHMQIVYKYEVEADGKVYKLETVKVITPYWNKWRSYILNGD